MRSNIPAAAALLIALTATPAGSQAPADAAATTCASFLKARPSDALHRQAANWLSGYASGYAAAVAAARQTPVQSLTREELLKSVSDFCQANPQATIALAASAWAPPPPPAGAAPVPAAEPAPLGRGWLLDLNNRPSNPGGRR
jgi:hypothetical protein